MRLDAIAVTDDSIVTLSPAPARRAWMDRTPERFANRCLPLMMANQAGWLVTLTEPVVVEWSGRDGHGEVEVLGSERVKENVASHFGSGIVTFKLPFLFRTEPGYNLLARGPANLPRDGLAPLEGLIETDWSVAPFTMNWQITRARTPLRVRPRAPPRRRGQGRAPPPQCGALASDRRVFARRARARRWARSSRRPAFAGVRPRCTMAHGLLSHASLPCLLSAVAQEGHPVESPQHAPSLVDSASRSRSDIPPATVSGEHSAATQAEDLRRSVVAGAPVVLWAVDPSGVFTLAEGGALAAMGPDAPRMAVGRSALDLYRGVCILDSGGRSTTGESLLRRALAGEPCAGLAEIGDARYDTRMVPMLGLEGEVTGVIGVATDVTERIRADARILREDRLTAVGTLAAGIAEEIDDPLSRIVKSLDFIAHRLRMCVETCRSAELVSGSSIGQALRESSSAVRFARDGSARVCRIVRGLHTFARSGSERRSLVDVRAILAPVIDLVSSQIQRRARLVRDFRDVPLVDVNEARLGQVLMNLLVNAAQAIPEGDAENNEIGVTTYTDEAGHAVFEIRDTGSGIPRDMVSHIFEPFVTTRPRGPSPGLGLPICHGIVTALGGEISVRSAPGSGSVFRVMIPAAR